MQPKHPSSATLSPGLAERIGIAVRLGRISNLPTVWTNVLAGAVLAGALRPGLTVLLAVAFSLFYVAGMYLNDAFDHGFDADERPERPIPSGQVQARTVFAAGLALLAAGLALLWASAGQAGHGLGALVFGAVLAAAIVTYDIHHKQNPLSPLLMGLCRVLVYLTTAVALTGAVHAAVVGGALAALSYLVGLTYAAKQETRAAIPTPWPLALIAVPALYLIPSALGGGAAALVPALWAAWTLWCLWPLLGNRERNIPKAVAGLIAGIALLDASLVATAGHAWEAGVAIALFVATLALQRFVPAT